MQIRGLVMAAAVVLASTVGGWGAAAGVTLPGGQGGPAGHWTLSPTVDPPGGDAGLAGVSCASPGFCVAVGTSVTGPGERVSHALTEVWYGRGWTISGTVPGASLAAVSCVAPTSCVAVGTQLTHGTSRPLAEVWNGQHWTATLPPQPIGTGTGSLSGVSCTSSTFCVAVGDTGVSGAARALAERYNGRTWAVAPTPDPAGPRLGPLAGVSCASPSLCVAVGMYGAGGAVSDIWHGAAWTVTPTPHSAQYALSGVSCSSTTFCAAVGAGGSGGFGPVAELWHGTAWQVVPTPSVGATISDLLSAVSCVSRISCTAVGEITGDDFAQDIVQSWNGYRWRQQLLGPPPDWSYGNYVLSAVSCRATVFCMAGGQYQSVTADSATWAEKHTAVSP